MAFAIMIGLAGVVLIVSIPHLADEHSDFEPEASSENLSIGFVSKKSSLLLCETKRDGR